MKRLLSLSLVLFVLTSLTYGEENISAKDVKPKVFLCVIRDTSPADEKCWNMQDAVNIEVFYSLREGDQLKELLARPGNPSILIDSIITADGFEKKYILNKISGISKEWLSSADIASAMEAAFDSFNQKGKNYQCLLIIITKGQMDNEHIAHIRRYAGAFKARGWPVCIVCDQEHTNRELLIAANNTELDIRFIDNASLSDWIDNVRSSSALKNLKDTTTQPKPKSETIDESIKAKDGKATSVVIPDGSVKQPIEVKFVEPPQQKAIVDVNKHKVGQAPEEAIPKPDAVADKKGNDGSVKQPIEVKFVEPPQQKAIVDVNKPKVGHAPEEAIPKSDAVADKKVNDGSVKQAIEVKFVEPPQQKAIVDANKPKVGQPLAKATAKQGAGTENKVNDSKKHKPSILDFIPIAILLAMFIGVTGLIVYLNSKLSLNSSFDVEENEGQQSHLIAFVFEQRYDLGPLDALGEITVGKGVGSTIYIDNETIEDRHLRIFKSGTGLKTQNLAPSPIIVSGSELAPRKKAVLDLPADIELTSEVTITVLSEPVEIDKEADNYETENV
jgi:hypothetical protein